MKIQIFVMPAWIAGIQVCTDASGNVHVSLDSSTPCWNDAIEGFCFKLTGAPPPRIFEGGIFMKVETIRAGGSSIHIAVVDVARLQTASATV
jgi:hypothetical protein